MWDKNQNIKIHRVWTLELAESKKPTLVQCFPRCFSLDVPNQGPKKGLTDARSAVGFCLGSGLFGSYNSD